MMNYTFETKKPWMKKKANGFIYLFIVPYCYTSEWMSEWVYFRTCLKIKNKKTNDKKDNTNNNINKIS